ncbi:neuronal acetylcholine receptor subunit alpha-7-like [Saccoglossus kowalevskii]|uniref:Neuronal acetylcholine receptor subunit alpha-7-like n=1 Tax=Saccoglossus kowalevskii TaxID=10224 RepID=A0ABM0GPA0_SACKO|nr:PREDICTED: neuronal acetylcholine receptor subunit alpha-7-like [Saccoglossus kowalevskii]
MEAIVWVRMRNDVEGYASDAEIQATLVRKLLENYSTSTRPALNSSIPTLVTHRITPIQILDIDEQNQLFTLKVWIGLRWTDELLRWNESDYAGVASVSVSSNDIWQPDITLYGSVDKEFERHLSTDAQVSSDGSVLALQPMVFKASCRIDATYFPFDEQKCILKFGSWSYDGSLIDLEINPSSGSLSNYIPNGEWSLIGLPIIKHVLYYACCPEPYPDITYTFVIRRRSLFYIYTLLMPVMLMFILILVGFYLPTECGERMTLFVTSMLSLFVFLSLASQYLPPTSDSTPYIQIYLMSTIGLVALSSILTGFSINLHYLASDCSPVPGWMRICVFKYIAAIVLLQNKTKPFLKATENSKHTEGDDDIHIPLVGEGSGDMSAIDIKAPSYITSLPESVQEWRMVAVVVDRLFMVLYLILFVSITAGIFMFLENRHGHFSTH